MFSLWWPEHQSGVNLKQNMIGQEVKMPSGFLYRYTCLYTGKGPEENDYASIEIIIFCKLYTACQSVPITGLALQIVVLIRLNKV